MGLPTEVFGSHFNSFVCQEIYYLVCVSFHMGGYDAEIGSEKAVEVL
jgi:hypothetical protein